MLKPLLFADRTMAAIDEGETSEVRSTHSPRTSEKDAAWRAGEGVAWRAGEAPSVIVAMIAAPTRQTTRLRGGYIRRWHGTNRVNNVSMR